MKNITKKKGRNVNIKNIKKINNNQNRGVNRMIVMIVIILIMTIIFFFLTNNTSKNFKIGNNTSSQEIIDYVLNIKSYEVIADIDVKSNKNKNKYKLKQIYNGKEDNLQEVLEPENIAGVKLIKQGNNLKLENSKLNLASILQNYEYISENTLDLSSFIEDYKNDNNSKWEEKDNQILMKTSNKTLYINRENGKPKKMEIHDNNKKIAVYILYTEVIVNS